MNVLRYLFFWEWFKRWRCHKSVAPCPKFHSWSEWDKKKSEEKTAAQLVEELANAVPEKSSVAESDEVWKAWNR